MDLHLDEILNHYRHLGAPEDQNVLISLLRELQQLHGGSIPNGAVRYVAQAYGIRETLLLALIRRIPSLRLGSGHYLELCAGPNCGKCAQLAACAEDLQAEGYYTLKYVPCMRLCGKGPNIRWDGKLYHRATEDLLRQLCRQS